MKEPKSILIISALDSWSMGEGKGGPALYRTLLGYAENGWNVYFLTGNRAAEYTVSAPHENIHVIRFDIPWLKRLVQTKKLGFVARLLWWVFFQVTAFFKALKLHRKTNVDVVYGYEIYGVPVAKILALLWHIPVVARFQGTILGVHWMKRKLWRIRAWEHVIGLRMPVDLVIMTNDGTQGDRVLQKLNVKQEKVRFWMNGVDWDLFLSSPDKEMARKLLQLGTQPVLLTVSRLVNWKHVERAIGIIPSLIRSFPDITLIIVGDGPEYKNLIQLADDLGVKMNVRFEGAVSHNEIPVYMAAADVFLSLYDWSNVGNPLIEAMISGKCIITLNNGDTGQFITNGINGVLLEYDDLPKLPELTEKLLFNQESCKKFGDNAQKFAKNFFWGWDKRIETEIREVNALIERKNYYES